MRAKNVSGSLAAMVVLVGLNATAGGVTPDAAAASPEPTFAEQVARLEDGAASNDLRVRIVHSLQFVVEDDADPARGVLVRELVPAADLVERARGATDPLVLDLMVHRCRLSTKTVAGCDALDFARRWTVADTQNQVAWLTLASVLKAHDDLVGARSAVVRAAQASSWHEHYRELAGVLAAASPATGSPRMHNAVLVDALARSSANALPLNAVAALGYFCNGDDEVKAACARIVAVMFRDADTMQSLTMAAPYARRARVDASIIAGYQQESDPLHWAMLAVAVGIDRETADDEALRADNGRLQTLITIGERQLLDNELLARHVAKSDAAARYVASLSREQREQRNARLASR